MSDSVRPHRQQPTRLPCPWDSPGKNTRMGCHFLLQCVKVKLLSHVWLLATPWTAAYQAPLSMGFSRQEYWSGLLLPSLLFHHRGSKCKSRKSRDTQNNQLIWPWSTKWRREKADRVLPREHTGHSKNLRPTTWDDSTHAHQLMISTKIRLIMFFTAKDGEALYSQQRQDLELTVA